jgi:hypothetical protein
LATWVELRGGWRRLVLFGVGDLKGVERQPLSQLAEHHFRGPNLPSSAVMKYTSDPTTRV